MHSFRVPKSSSTAAATRTSDTASRVSQPELAVGQRQQGSFIALSTTLHAPELTRISSNYYQQDEQGLLPETGTTQIAPFEAPATHQTVTFDDHVQGHSASSLSHSNEPSLSQRSSQPVDGVVPIVREEPSLVPADKWIMMSGDEKKPFKCGYKGCGKKYSKKEYVQTHFVTHTGDSRLRCYSGKCAGTVIYRDVRALTRHIHARHTFERSFRCEFCDRRFRRADHLKNHMKRVHPTKIKKKSPKRHSDFIKLSSAASATMTASISTITSRFSQPELAAGQRQQSSCVNLSKTVHRPVSTLIPATDHQQDESRLLFATSVSDISASQVGPCETLATHQAVTFYDCVQGQSASSLSLFNEPSGPQRSSQSVDAVVPIVREEPSPVPTDKWILISVDEKKPFNRSYKGCGRKRSQKEYLQTYFVTHTGESQLRCYFGECTGTVIYRDVRDLTRHIRAHHPFERPFRCELCDKRFWRAHHLKKHLICVHSINIKKKPPKRHKDFIKSSSAATATMTASISTTTSRFSQPELAAEQRQQGSFVDLSKTFPGPESTLMPATDHHQDESRLLSALSVSDISASQVDPFETLATHQTVTFDDDDQEQPANSASLYIEPSQPFEGSESLVRGEPEAVFHLIIPIKSGGNTKIMVMTSIPKHQIMPSINDHFRQALSGTVPEALLTTIAEDPEYIFGCELCDRRFRRKDILRYHKEYVHSPEN